MYLLEGAIRHYAWGSHDKIARLQGRAVPTAEPEAELWLGAHPASPAMLRTAAGAVPLTQVISADPFGVLGERAVGRFGHRLPFLLKVLAAAQPLSLQAHPDREQAAAGFAADEAAGVPIGAPNRTYADDWHKPELLVAVSAFEALCGFQDPKRSADLLAGLAVPALAPTVQALLLADHGVALRSAVRGLLTAQPGDVTGLVDAVTAAAREHAGEHETYALVERLAARYPGDAGIIVAMLLNHITLAPGDAVWMPAGNLHAYLDGVGIEIMAASDNVLRGGLTPKYVNVPELLGVLRFDVLADPILQQRKLADGMVTWPVPVDDFALVLARVHGAAVTLPGDGPRVLLCLDGTVTCRDEASASGETVTLRRGHAAFVPASAGSATVWGDGEVYQASVG